MPAYLTAVYPGSRHVVFEVDPELVDLARERLRLVTGPDLRVEAGDARLLTRRLPDDSQDLVVGDAFGDLSVPWHLTTREFLTDVKRVMRPDGLYVLNLIDYPPLRFARSETATLAAVFRHVAVLAPPSSLAGDQGGNFVLAASDRPFDVARIDALIRARTVRRRWPPTARQAPSPPAPGSSPTTTPPSTSGWPTPAAGGDTLTAQGAQSLNDFSTKVATSLLKRRGFSHRGVCPTPSYTSKRALGMISPSVSCISRSTRLSASPQIKSVGTLTVPSSARSS